MKPGIGFPSLTLGAVWSAQTGVFSEDYPASNAGIIKEPSRVARAPGGQTVAIGVVLAATYPVRLISIINHNLPQGATFQIQGYSTTNPHGGSEGIVYESGYLQAWPAGGPVEGYRAVRPHLLPAAINMRSFRVIFFNTGQPIEIGAVEASGFWEWPGISPGRELGVRADADRTDLVGGSSHVQGKGAPIVARGSIDLLKMAVAQTTGLDFQAYMDKRRPFVWAEDFDDPATWARKCLLVRNEELPPSVGALYRHDRFQFRLVEHLR